MNVKSEPASAIIPGRLYQGDKRSPLLFGSRVGYVPGRLHIACAAELPPPPVEGQRSIHLTLEDDPTVDWMSVPGWSRAVHRAARAGAHALRRGYPVLTTCRAGMNRSGLLSALILCNLGTNPDEAVYTIQDKRGPGALENPRFIEAVLFLGN